MTIKDSKYVKINNVNPLCLIINKVNGYFEEINGNKYLTLARTKKSKEIIKKHWKLWSKIRDLVRSITQNSDDDDDDDDDEKYMKTKFNSDGDLPLNKTIEIHNMIASCSSCFSW